MKLICATIIMLAFTSSAFADECRDNAVLACSTIKNEFQVRFGMLCNEETVGETRFVPTALIVGEAWSSLSIAPEGVCTLPNKKRVEVGNARGQAFAYGMGGGDPEAQFSLTIGKLAVYVMKTYYEGHNSQSYPINAIRFADGKLLECHGHKDETSTIDADCSDVSQRLIGNALTQEELDARNSLISDQKFASNISTQCQEMAQIVKLQQRQPDAYIKLGDTFVGHLSSRSLDLNNDGRPDEILRVAGGSHYFDGSYLIAFLENPDEKNALITYLKKNELDVEGRKNIELLPEWRAYFISLGIGGASARYVTNMPFVFKRKTYIYTFSLNRDTRPRITIAQIKPNNTFQTICQFPSDAMAQ